MLRTSRTSGTMAPEDVGFGLLRRVTPVSVARAAPGAGRSNVVFWLEKRAIEPTEERVQRIFEVAKQSSRVLTDDEVYVLVGSTSPGSG